MGVGCSRFMAMQKLSGSEPKRDDMPHTSPVLHPPGDRLMEMTMDRTVTIHFVVIIFTNSAYRRKEMNR